LESVQQNPDALDTLPLVLSNGVLQTLRAQLAELKKKEVTLSHEFGDRHPDLIKARAEIKLVEDSLRAQLTKLTESVKHDYEEALAIEQNLVEALNGQKRDVLALNRKSIEYGALQRQATSDRQIYEQLLAQTQARGVTGNTPTTKIRIVEPAERPAAPIGPQNLRDLALVFAAGFVLCLGAPLLVETFDRRLKTPADVEQSLQLRCIAIVPTIAGKRNNTAVSAFNEAFRRIRTAVAFSRRQQGAVSLLVTSSSPQEGKSLITASVAMALARANQRVLLVDADLRRPVQHKRFKIKAAPGLSDLLSRSLEDIDAAVSQTEIPNLFVLPCGSTNAAAAELLSSSTLSTLMNEFALRFDWIVFDSPPVGPVADACIIAPLVHRTLVVVSADVTLTAAAQAAVDQLRAAGVTHASAILNRVDLAHSAYYYEPYHYSGYETYQSGAIDLGERNTDSHALSERTPRTPNTIN
jgi:polysaccharide biosynthesis transport protein